MRKSLLLALMAFAATMAVAQVNNKPGYIITNVGDTVRGEIDFRTNEMLSTRCEFRASGTSTYTTYKPGDIESFRFDNNGKYYVTRRLNITGEPQLYFAEFIVSGKMNLYCVPYGDDEYFFFEREDGEMAELTNRSIYNMSSQERIVEKRKQYAKVKSLLQDSKKAMFAVDGADMSRTRLVDIVRDYHKDVCTDGSNCVEYEYTPDNDNYKLHIKAGGGYAYYAQEMTDQQHYAGENYPASVYEIGLGLEIELERVMKGLSVEGGFILTPKYRSEHDVLGNEYLLEKPSPSKMEKTIITCAIGGVKRFGRGKIQPLVRGGGFGAFHLGVKEYKYNWITAEKYQEVELEWNSSIHFGVYIGAGAQLNLGSHFIRLHGDLYKSLESYSKMTKWGITAEFGF